MGNIEFGDCKIGEYAYWSEERLREEDLCINGIYVIMFAYEGGPLEAGKYPARVNGVTSRHDGMFSVNFDIINKTSVVPRKSRFYDAFWLKEYSEGIQVDTQLVREAFFKEEYPLAEEDDFMHVVVAGGVNVEG